MSTYNSSRLYRDAVRLLFILSEIGEDCAAAPEYPGTVRVINSKVKLEKLDFWMRSPDYLANEILNLYEETSSPELLRQASDILGSNEPELRRIEMTRYLYGAYEPVDDGFSVLQSYGLAYSKRGKSSTRYYLFERGLQVAAQMASEVEGAQWYQQRATLVSDFAKKAGLITGSQMKDQQYKQAEYEKTPHGVHIPTIVDRVRSRLQKLEAS